jgi:hypothetical protein
MIEVAQAVVNAAISFRLVGLLYHGVLGSGTRLRSTKFTLRDSWRSIKFDATLVPEPASLAFVAAGALHCKRRAKLDDLRETASMTFWGMSNTI